MSIQALDHFVLTVEDIDRACEFYSSFEGIDIDTFENGRTALRIGDQKINLHEMPVDREPVAREPTAGSGDFCLLTETPVSDLADDLSRQGTDIVLGPVERTGARGPLTSIYVRDPEGNLVEIANVH